MYIIRGARIVEQLLHERSTVPQLDANIQRAYPHTRLRQHVSHTVRLHSLVYVPFIGTKMFTAKAVCSTESGTRYNTTVQLLNVIYGGEDTVDVVDDTGKVVQVQPIKLQDHNVKVKCNCLDFYHRFAQHNNRDQSLLGRAPRPYQRTTTDHPSVNPLRVPGVCKHIVRVIEELESVGIVVR